MIVKTQQRRLTLVNQNGLIFFIRNRLNLILNLGGSNFQASASVGTFSGGSKKFISGRAAVDCSGTSFDTSNLESAVNNLA